ncbi:hypothetical protein ECDEC12E_5350 [Escherichia coli DEC12E]|nr:hypothetical protein ECDEC12E_5350 [Escherichia coli DEC12E]DAL66138.1 MAG TPA_asm: hypothetical protein [Caudoviricetes sp.]
MLRCSVTTSVLNIVVNAQADARKTLQLLRKRAVRRGN